MRRRVSLVLAGLTFAFFLRVIGQVLVAFFDASFLPPMEQWYSGLMPYPLLLPTQILILVVQTKIVIDVWRGTGRFADGSDRKGWALVWFAAIYAAAMILRYVVTMAIHPERRWFFGTIPIFFHFVLAGFLFVLGRFYLRTAQS